MIAAGSAPRCLWGSLIGAEGKSTGGSSVTEFGLPKARHLCSGLATPGQTASLCGCPLLAGPLAQGPNAHCEPLWLLLGIAPHTPGVSQPLSPRARWCYGQAGATVSVLPGWCGPGSPPPRSQADVSLVRENFPIHWAGHRDAMARCCDQASSGCHCPPDAMDLQGAEGRRPGVLWTRPRWQGRPGDRWSCWPR